MTSNPFAMTQEGDQVASSDFVSKAYGWMTMAHLLTAGVAWGVASSDLMPLLIKSQMFYLLLIVELALVWILSATIHRLSVQLAMGMFIAYAILNGVTLSIIFLVYTTGSIVSTFLVTALTFGGMCTYGYFTKSDLTSVGNLCFMALWGLILASLVNLFWANSSLYWITTYAGVLIFVGLTAFDAQKIKQMSQGFMQSKNEGKLETRAMEKSAIMGALALYLDFINIFLYLLRILGSRR